MTIINYSLAACKGYNLLVHNYDHQHMFRTAEGNVTFAVYQGQDCPQANVGEPGDVCARGSDVFVKTLGGWQLYPINAEPSKRICHPEHPRRVLSLKDGWFAWMALSTFRVRKKRMADKDVKGQTVNNNPATADDLPITPHGVELTNNSGEIIFNHQFATSNPPPTILSSSGTVQGQ